MRSYLLQWLVFFLICLCFGSSDEKPFLSNLIQTAGRKIQKAVSFLKKSTPVSKLLNFCRVSSQSHQIDTVCYYKQNIVIFARYS